MPEIAAKPEKTMQRQLHNDLQQAVLTLKEEVLHLDGVLKDAPTAPQWVQKLVTKRNALQCSVVYLEQGLANVQIED